MIELKNLSAGYNKTNIISDINVHFKKGEITTIIGPNGSGKSTLLKAISGLCKINKGQILLKDKLLAEYSNSDRSKIISYLPQQRPLPSITVKRIVLHGRFPHLGYPRKYRKEDYDLCNLAMEQANVIHLKERNMEELSGGERQKVYLAMAYASQSEIFLMDEPMTFLDIRYQIDLLSMMKKMKAEGKTVITILHDLNSAMHTADKILVMNKGTIAGFDTPENIFDSKVLEDVFQIKQKLILDENGKKYYVFH